MYVYRLNLLLFWCVSVSVLFILSALYLWEWVMFSTDVNPISQHIVHILVLLVPKEWDVHAFKERQVQI